MNQIIKTLKFLDENGNSYPEWEEKKLGDVAINNPKKYDPLKSNAAYRSVELEHLDGGGLGKINGWAESLEQKSKKNVFKAGDILLGKLRPYLKKWAHPDFDGVCSTEIWVLTGKENVSNAFLYFLIQSPAVQQTLIDITSGTKMPRADWEVVAMTKIAIPTLLEQEKIIGFLSVKDEHQELVAEKIKLLKEQRQGYLQQVFNRDLVFTDDKGNKYPEWEEKKLGEIAHIKMGFTPSTENKSFWDGDIPWLSITGFKGKYIAKGNKFISPEALGKKSLLPAGSLVMSFKLTLGKLGILTTPMVTNEAICSFEWKNEETTTAEFAFYALSSLKFEKFANRAAAGLTLNDKSLKLLPMHLPTLPEQQKIVEFFSALDENIELNEKKLELLKEQKKGYLQGIFGI